MIEIESWTLVAPPRSVISKTAVAGSIAAAPYLTTAAGASYFVALIAAGVLVGSGAALLAILVFRRFRGLLLEGAIAE